MTAVRQLWGPSLGGAVPTTDGNFDLDDSDDSVAWVFAVPKDGTITKVGFSIDVVNGSPPNYYAGLVTLDSSGDPTASAYGSSSPATLSSFSTGWVWATLSSSASASAGDIIAMRVWPTGSPSNPNSSNSIDVLNSKIGDIRFPHYAYYSISWQKDEGIRPFAVKYDDNYVYGLATEQVIGNGFDSGNSPDEQGCRFTLPAAMTCFGARIDLGYSNNAPFDVILYDSSDTTLASASIGDPDDIDGASTGSVEVFWDEIDLEEDETYRLTVKPTSGTYTVSLAHFVFADSNDKAGWMSEASRWQKTHRTNSGSWTDVSTELIGMALWVNDIDMGSGGQSAAAGKAFAYIG